MLAWPPFNFNLSRKLLVGISFVSVLALLSIAFSLDGLSQAQREQKKLIDQTLPVLKISRSIAYLINKLILDAEFLIEINDPEKFAARIDELSQSEELVEEKVSDLYRIEENFVVNSLVSDMEKIKQNVGKIKNIVLDEKVRAVEEVKRNQQEVESTLREYKQLIVSNTMRVPPLSEKDYSEIVRLQQYVSGIDTEISRYSYNDSIDFINKRKHECLAMVRAVTDILTIIENESVKDSFAALTETLLDQVVADGKFFSSAVFLAEYNELLTTILKDNTGLNESVRVSLDELLRVSNYRVSDDLDRFKRVLDDRRNILFSLLIFMVVFIIIFVFYFVIPQITNRLNRLAFSTRQIMKGNLNENISVSGSDEISRMLQALEELRLVLKKNESLNKDNEEYNERMTLALDAEGMGVWELSLRSNALLWDKRMHDLYMRSFSTDESLQVVDFDDWMLYLPEKRREEYKQQLHESVKKREKFVCEHEIVLSPEVRRYVRTIASIITKNGIAERAVGVSYDITDRYLSNVQLIEAKNQAENATKTKSEFLANMSHEIRTPMNGVLGMLNIAMKNVTDFEQTKRLELAYSSANSLLGIINDILDFSKIEAGRMELELIEFSLMELISELAKSLSAIAYEKGISIVVDLSEVKRNAVIGDPVRVRQILNNLLSNAIKFTSVGEINIKAKLTLDDDKKYKFECWIIDSGIGIDPDKISSLFNPFSQADTSTTRNFGGTGLGLAIVSQLCELMEGDIIVCSIPAGGSTFKFTINLQQPRFTSEAPVIDCSSVSALILDQHVSSRNTIRRQIESWGISVNACSIEQYLQSNKLRTVLDHYDVIFIDQAVFSFAENKFFAEIDKEKSLGDAKRVLICDCIGSADHLNLNDFAIDSTISRPVTQSDLFDIFAPLAHNRDQILSHDVVGGKVKASHTTPLFTKETRVLLVEDNAVNRAVANDILNDIGLQVANAANGAEAISMLQSTYGCEYDLILMDCQMPEMDGYQASRAIRSGLAGDHYKNTVIIALTANAMIGDREKCLNSGMNDYVTKPINPDMLIEKIENYIRGGDVVQYPEAIDHTEEQLSFDVWDRDVLSRRVKGKEERVQRLITLYLEQKNKRDEFLKRASSGDADINDIADFAHSVKGSAGNLGCNKLFHLAEVLEIKAREEEEAEVDVLMKGFREAIAEVDVTFSSYLKGSTATSPQPSWDTFL
ncbi:response regulator [Teredinibacter sp. KSP-S5-2]|uniref:response regulator n=1 Tax=Teredinibacter sp. KSP-S5-2 TaxID=3034506 RepID=UPI00293480A9|nr:response regulator [Teredinibacter sp. KSP-S5-2]WNO10716.1 response regulator [Teredinibacter sp. KSP-S5-2]